MPNLKISIVGEDFFYNEQVEFSIPENSWERLVSFKSEAGKLRSTRFVQNERGGQISFNFIAGKPIWSNARKIDMEEVSAMLHRLRPFVLQNEQHYFHSTNKLLKRFLVHPSFRNYLDELADGFNLKTMQQNLFGHSCELVSKELVMDWLNSFEYHRDQDKRVAVEDILSFFSKDQDGAPIVLFSLVDMIKSILYLSDLIETLMLIEKGEMFEIKCFERHLIKV